MEKFKLALPGERWITVEGTNGKNAVSDQGRIASFHKSEPIILKPHPSKNGYLKVIFHKDGKQITIMPHRLVAKYFVANPDNKLEVNHINGIKEDNRADNLEWVTRGENCRHAVANGLHRGFEKGHQVANRHRGERSPTAVLTEDQVRAIRLDRDSGLKQREISEKYKIKMSTVRSALMGWKHIT